MKNSAHFQSSGFPRRSSKILWALLVAGVAACSPAFAENAQEARVTRIVKDVKLVGGSAAARPATLSDMVRPGNGVRTGTDSRAELTFQDLSITRLGANTVFSFNGAGRTVDLGGGAILVEAPPNSAAIHVNTAAFSAAVSGGTGLVEFHPQGISKIMIMEGNGQVTPNGGTSGGSMTIPAGEMVTLGPDGKWITGQKFNVALVMKSSNLITDFGALPNEQLIFQVIDQQKNDFGGSPNNQPPHDTTLENTIDRNDAAPLGGSPAPTPPPSLVITSPNPYLLTNLTNITTDPTITTNGQTNQGSIYHGQTIDGPVSTFLFGSFSAFDLNSGFEASVGGGTDAATVFKFTALQITGSPTIDTTNGPVDLGLVGLNGITSAAPGGTITFSGLRGVLLATQNGPITLGSEVSFADLHDINFYARGANGNLSLGSAISGITHTRLFAEQSMSLSSTIQSETIMAVSGGDMTIHGINTLQASGIELFSAQALSWDGETSDVAASDSTSNGVSVEANGNINVAGDLSFTRHSEVTPGIQSLDESTSDSVDLTLSGGQNVTIGGILSLVVDNSNGGGIDSGGNVTVNAGGNLTVNGSSGITLNVLNQGGSIGNGGNISVTVGGDLKAEALDALINTRDNGSIGHAVTLAVSVGGDLDLDSGSQLEIATGADEGSNGGTIAGAAVVSVSAHSISGASTNAIWEIANGDGSHVQGNATVSGSISGNAGFALGGLFDIENNSVNTLHGGVIDGDADVSFSAANISSGAGSLTFSIHNQGNGDGAGGQIGGNANIFVGATNIASASTDRGDISLEIKNDAGSISRDAFISLTATGAIGSTFAGNLTGSISNSDFGSIGGNAMIVATANSLSSGNLMTFSIDNTTGNIGGNATVHVTSLGSGITLPSAATFEILNDASLTSIVSHEGPPAGVISGSATVSVDFVSGGFMNDDGITAQITNEGGQIGADAQVTFHVVDAMQATAGNLNFQILNGGGSIGMQADVSVSAASIIGNDFRAQIDNTNGFIGSRANVDLNSGGDVTSDLNSDSTNGVLLQILNEGGRINGIVDGDGVHYTAGGTTTTPALQLYFDNANGGTVVGGASLTLTATGPVVLNGPLGLEIDNFNGGSITQGGSITAHFGGDISDTAGSMHSLNFFVFNGGDSVFIGPQVGGVIGTGGNIDLTFDGNVATTPTATTGSFGIEIANDNGAITDGGNITVASSGNITARIVSALISNQSGTITNGANITFNTTGTITSTGFTNFEVINIGGTIGNTPQINVHAGSFNVGTALVADYDNEGGNIGPGGTGNGVVSITSDGGITVTNGMWVFGQVTAGGDIDVGTMRSTDVTTTGNINVGSGGIQPFRFVDGNNTVPDVAHTLSAAHITSTGGINFNGDNSDGTDLPGNGGTLTLHTGAINFDPEGDIRGSVTLNGGDAGGESASGDGGHLTVNASGAVTVNTPIEATTGHQDSLAEPSGNGGSVTLTSTGGLVTVNSRIEVSSDDPTPDQSPPPPIRRSATGGSILLQSNLTTGQGITIGANGQLLSLHDSEAPGPGGSITLSTKGAAITVAAGAKIEADSGTITMDQSDPANPGAISIDGATLTSATLAIHGAADVDIGQTNKTTLNFSSGTVNAANNVNWNVADTTISPNLTSLNMTAGNALNLSGGGSGKPVALTLNLTADSTFTAGSGGIIAPFVDIHYAGAALNLMSGGDITADSIAFTDFFARGTVNAAGAITVTNDLSEGGITAGTSLSVGGNLYAGSVTAGTTVSVGVTGPSGPTSGTIQASSVTAGGDITTYDTFIQTITSPTGVLNVGDAIKPYVFSTDSSFPAQGAMAPHVYTVDSIVAPNGIDFSGNQFGGINGYSSGGLLTVNANTLTVDSSTGVGAMNLNGADAGATDFNGNVFTTVGGDGGTFIVNATGNITANNGTDITATTGNNASGDNGFSGAGGSVTLASTGGTVTVGDTIQVSSDDPTPSQTPPPPIRRSNSGGNITLTSGKATGTAIQINSTAQLLSLLDNAATGPGGVITVKATGASSAVNVAGQIEADHGTIDVEQTGTNGSINLGPGLTSVAPSIQPDGFLPAALTMSADVIKAGALGANGVLMVGDALLNANTLISLYGGSAGSVEFYANCTLSGAAVKIIAASTVTIDNAVTVTITGAAAAVYADTRNYDSASGGNGTGGSFSGSVSSHPYNQAPGFGATGSVASNHSAGSRSGTSSGAAGASTASSSNQTTRTTPSTVLNHAILVH